MLVDGEVAASVVESLVASVLCSEGEDVVVGSSVLGVTDSSQE